MNTIQSVLDCIDLSKYNNILEPSAGKGTDATSYSWFLFKKNFDGNQQIRVLK